MAAEEDKFAVEDTASQAREMLANFWTNIAEDVNSTTVESFRKQELPLARIKKIMKLDEDVKMISQEAPILFAKAAEIFISELSLRGWLHTEENKRKTLQKSDISMAVSKYDQFDFLIDIVPREEVKPVPTRKEDTANGRTTSMLPEQVQYYFQLGQNQQQTANQGQAVQVQSGGQPTVVQLSGGAAMPIIQALTGGGDAGGAQIIQLQQPVTSTAQPTVLTGSASAPNSAAGVQVVQQSQPVQVMQQVVGANGEVTTMPITLSQSQLQALQSSLQNSRSQGGQVVIQGAQQPQAVAIDASSLTTNGQPVQTIFLQQQTSSTAQSDS